jgi:adenylate cyclase
VAKYRIRWLWESPKISALIIGLLVFLSILGLRGAGQLETAELAAYDWFVRLRPYNDAPADRVIIVGIFEDDIRRQGRWPLTDATLAQVLRTLVGFEPTAIGLDIYRDIPVPPGTSVLEKTLSENDTIITVFKFGVDGVPPPPVLKDGLQVGFNDILVDPGGVVRRALLFLDDGRTVYYSFPLRLALAFLEKEGIAPRSDPEEPAHIKLGPTTIRPLQPDDGGYVNADARGYQFLMNFRKAPFHVYPLTSLLSGDLDPKLFKDKVVLIGSMAQSVQDIYYTPLSRGVLERQQLWGVALHAHVLDQLLGFALEGIPTTEVLRERDEALWILFWSLLGGLIGVFLRSTYRVLLWGGGSLLSIYGVAHAAFAYGGLWVPLVPPAMACVFSTGIVTAYMHSRERRQRAVLMQLFSKCVSKDIVDVIWQEREKVLKNGRPRDQRVMVTTLFSDLKGFTSLTEGMVPESIMEWLNTYMESMTGVIMRYGGVIDRFAGDGIKADFGIPIPRLSEEEIRRDASNAVHCALEMQEEMKRLEKLLEEKQLPSTTLRIGIFTGPAIAGVIGSAERMQYTTLGDSVNIAARLESLDKDMKNENTCRILIGQTTLDCIGDEFKTSRVGEVNLRGFHQKVEVYHVLGVNRPRSNKDKTRFK